MYRKKGKLSLYYVKITMNVDIIIIELVNSAIAPCIHKITNGMSYTEITNDKILTYSISEVTCRSDKNIKYNKEEMYYNDLRDIVNNEIIYCIGELCKKKKNRIISVYANLIKYIIF